MDHQIRADINIDIPCYLKRVNEATPKSLCRAIDSFPDEKHRTSITETPEIKEDTRWSIFAHRFGSSHHSLTRFPSRCLCQFASSAFLPDTRERPTRLRHVSVARFHSPLSASRPLSLSLSFLPFLFLSFFFPFFLSLALSF